MEPLAPGTEDDIDNSQIPTGSKKVSQFTVLNRYIYIFSVKYKL